MRPEGRMGYLLRGHEGERNNCFSKVQLVGQKTRDQTTLAIDSYRSTFLPPKSGAFRYFWAITYSLVVAQPMRMHH